MYMYQINTKIISLSLFLFLGGQYKIKYRVSYINLKILRNSIPENNINDPQYIIHLSRLKITEKKFN